LLDVPTKDIVDDGKEHFASGKEVTGKAIHLFLGRREMTPWWLFMGQHRGGAGMLNSLVAQIHHNRQTPPSGVSGIAGRYALPRDQQDIAPAKNRPLNSDKRKKLGRFPCQSHVAWSKTSFSCH
jgi:hypothetical protein